MGLSVSLDIGQLAPFSRDDCAIIIKECASDGATLTATTGDGAAFFQIGVTSGTEINPVVSNFTKKGDSGRRLVDKDTEEALEVTTNLLQRDAASRSLPRNAKGKFYQVLIVGAELGTKLEVWAAFGQFKLGNWKYSLAEGELSGLKFVTLSNNTTISITLPTIVTTATATLTIPAKAMYTTSDVNA
jgi:hypothetical protein